MATTKQNLESQIDSQVKANGVAEVTGPVLNTVLRNMSDTLFGSTYLFPKDVSLQLTDVGKLMMNDGSGTAKVYQLSPATNEQLGRFVIKIKDLADLNDMSAIKVSSLTTNEFISRKTWRNGNTPNSPIEELGLIQNYFESNPNLSKLTVSTEDTQLVIDENTFDSTDIKLNNFPGDALFVDTISRPALPAAPTAFPLGKLCGIDGDNAIISCNSIETYMLDGNFSVDNTLFNNENDIDFNTMEALANAVTHIVVPSVDGKVKSVNLNDFNFDTSFFKSFRHHFLGLAIASTANSITVINLNYLSFVGNFFIRLQQKGVLGKNSN